MEFPYSLTLDGKSSASEHSRFKSEFTRKTISDCENRNKVRMFEKMNTEEGKQKG